MSLAEMPNRFRTRGPDQRDDAFRSGGPHCRAKPVPAAFRVGPIRLVPRTDGRTMCGGINTTACTFGHTTREVIPALRALYKLLRDANR